jgi:uncharacterized lipoprotein
MRHRLIVGAVIALGLAGCGSQTAKTVTDVVTQTATRPKPASTTGLSDQKLNAALALNLANSKVHEGVTRLGKKLHSGATASSTMAAVSSFYAGIAKLHSNFDTAVSNIHFPASDDHDVKTLLVADTALEDALTNYANDSAEQSSQSVINSDQHALTTAQDRFDAALTAVQYDVGDSA